MPTYLHIESLRTDTAQNWYRNKYELRHVDYELHRTINHKGEIISEVIGGRIRVVINGFGDEDLFGWLFDPIKRKDGAVVTTDDNEKVMEKFAFANAKAVGYHLHFDVNTKNAISAVLIIDAAEILTENALHYKRK